MATVFNDNLRGAIVRLEDLTRAQMVHWQPTTEPDTFLTVFGGWTAKVAKLEYGYFFTLRNPDGVVIDEVEVETVAKGMPRNQNQAEAQDRLSSLFEVVAKPFHEDEYRKLDEVFRAIGEGKASPHPAKPWISKV